MQILEATCPETGHKKDDRSDTETKRSFRQTACRDMKRRTSDLFPFAWSFAVDLRPALQLENNEGNIIRVPLALPVRGALYTTESTVPHISNSLLTSRRDLLSRSNQRLQE